MFPEGTRVQGAPGAQGTVIRHVPGMNAQGGHLVVQWDSGQVGWIYVTLAKLRQEFSVRAVTKGIRERAIKQLEQEVKTYDDFLTGHVYGFIVEDEDGDQLDSLYGIYDDHDLGYVKSEARQSAEGHRPKSVVHAIAESTQGAGI